MSLLLDILAGLIVAWAAFGFVIGWKRFRRSKANPAMRESAGATMGCMGIIMVIVALLWLFGSRIAGWVGSWAETPTLL